MPHISIKCYPGRTEEQKKLLAERITKEIEPQRDYLYKKPGYTRE